MVIFKVNLATPGLPGQMLASGFEDLSKPAVVGVGPERIQFQLPMKHLTVIPFFDKALNGNFQEAETKEINMPDDDPAVFRIFIHWLYRGIADPALLDASIDTWCHLLLMADKWCLDRLASSVAKIIHNALMADIDAGKGTVRHSIVASYILLAQHRYRYLVVHAAYVRGWAQREAQPFQQLFTEAPAFFRDYFSWEFIIRHTARAANAKRYQSTTDIFKAEGDAHSDDQVLIKLLFENKLPAAAAQYGLKQESDEEDWNALKKILNI